MYVVIYNATSLQQTPFETNKTAYSREVASFEKVRSDKGCRISFKLSVILIFKKIVDL